MKESSCQHFFNTTHDIINYDVIENNDFLKLEYLENETKKSKISKGLDKQLFILYNISKNNFSLWNPFKGRKFCGKIFLGYLFLRLKTRKLAKFTEVILLSLNRYLPTGKVE